MLNLIELVQFVVYFVDKSPQHKVFLLYLLHHWVRHVEVNLAVDHDVEEIADVSFVEEGLTCFVVDEACIQNYFHKIAVLDIGVSRLLNILKTGELSEK